MPAIRRGDGLILRYLSTRGGGPPQGFEDVLFGGLAPDGGLYLPDRWPRLDPDQLAALAALPYGEVATRLLAPFVAGALSERQLGDLVERAYATFDHEAVAPLVQLAPNQWLLELFHGPSLAFKDVALQLLGLLFEHFLALRERPITIVGATSGDTGAAAIAATAGRARMTTVILHPHGRISDVQRRQMTTVDADNVHNVAVEGTFDDCQALLKAMFADQGFRERAGLAAINSINWARVMAQAVYYVTAALALGGPWRRVSFAVPTGNFGDVYAGYVAHRMGLPIDRLIVATNRNDILARFFAGGTYRVGEVHPTISPSMDIQVASNFERLLFDLAGRDGAAVARWMAGFAQSGSLAVDADALGRARELFDAGSVDEQRTLAIMAEVHRASGHLIDPHTAVGIGAGRSCPRDPAVPLICLATAHPAKFPDAVRRATGVSSALPERLADLARREERFTVLPNDLLAVRAHVEAIVMETA